MSNNPNDGHLQGSQNFSSFGSFSSFGQFGQKAAGTTNVNTHWGFEAPVEGSGTSEPESKAPESQTASLDSNFDVFIDSPQNTVAVDSDSFLAEPSMTAAEFDSTFVKESSNDEGKEDENKFPFVLPEYFDGNSAYETENVQPEIVEPSPEPEVIEPSPEPSETISLTSPDTIPQIIEESEQSSPYLESPQSTLIQDAAVDASFPIDDEFEVIDAAEFMDSEIQTETIVTEEATVEEVKEPKTPKARKASSKVETPKVTKTETPKVTKTETPKVTKSKSPAKSPAKSPTKSVAKSPVKASIEEAVEEETRHSGRQRSTVQRLEATLMAGKKVGVSDLVIPNGSGARLGDIEEIAKSINGKVAANEQMILLHRILYDRMGEASKRKANIRAFCGVEASNEEDGVKAFETKLKKYAVANIKNLAILLCLPSSGGKNPLISRIATFLVKPSSEVVKAVKAPKPVKVIKTKHTNRTAALKRKNSQESIGDAVKKPRTAKPVTSKVTKSRSKNAEAVLPQQSYLTPETVESDIDSDVEREVLDEINNSA